MIRKGYRDLINEAIHNHYHDNTELEMRLKDYFKEVQELSEAADNYLPFLFEIQKLNHMSRDFDIQVTKIIRDFEEKLSSGLMNK